jgi:hypothetical protein
MYAHRGRGITTDRRDVIALEEANRRGIYRPAHRVSAAQRTVRRPCRCAISWCALSRADCGEPYWGVVPHEASSGERPRRGSIPQGRADAHSRGALQASWSVWRSPRGSATLHAWVHRLADRRGNRIAIVALARRLTRILFAMWRDGRDSQAARVSRVGVAA